MWEEALAGGWDNLVSRWSGPLSLRLLVQPAVAIFFAIRAGLHDARQNEPPFLWAVMSRPDSRSAHLHQVWKGVGMVFILALVLDAIYQVMVHGSIFAAELLITATILALVPYLVVRGLTTRVANWIGIESQSAHSRGNEETKK